MPVTTEAKDEILDQRDQRPVSCNEAVPPGWKSMSHSCQHRRSILIVTPSARGCEECLRTGDWWVHLSISGHVDMSAVATTLRTGTRPHIFMQAVTRSLRATIRRKGGAGAISTSSPLIFPTRRPRSVRYRGLSNEGEQFHPYRDLPRQAPCRAISSRSLTRPFRECRPKWSIG